MLEDAIRNLVSSLTTPGPGMLPREALGHLAEEVDQRLIEQRLSRMLYDLTVLRPFNGPDEFAFGSIDTRYLEAIRADSPSYLIEALNYLRLYRAVAQRFCRVVENANERWFESALPSAEETLIDAVEELPEFNSQLLSSKIVLGKLRALRRRNLARQDFQSSIAAGNFDQTMGVFGHDCGLMTYFDSAHLQQSATIIGERRESLSQVIATEWQPPKARFLVVMSCEERYFRMYLPYWLSVAEYLKDEEFGYYIILTCTSADAGTISLDRAEALRHELARFRGCAPRTYADNVGIAPIVVPPWCSDGPTFAACARLLYARGVGEQTGQSVVCQDIDFCLVEDPTPWFSALRADKIALTSERIALTIDPWRKFLGGTYVLPATVRAYELFEKVENYLLAGLGERHPWYLDQNSLSYLHEISHTAGEVAVTSLHGSALPARPARAHSIHYMFKRRQMIERAEGSSLTEEVDHLAGTDSGVRRSGLVTLIRETAPWWSPKRTGR